MVEESPFQALIRRARAGDQAAAAELVQVYEPVVRRAVRVWLVDPRLRRRFDSTDVCQSVFADFFVGLATGRYDLKNPEQLLNLLVHMSRRKLVSRARREAAARRDFRRTRTGPLAENGLVEPAPGPAQQVEADELLREFRKRLSEEERQVAEERTLGHDWYRIAAARGDSPSAVRKRLARAVARIGRDLHLDGFDED